VETLCSCCWPFFGFSTGVEVWSTYIYITTWRLHFEGRLKYNIVVLLRTSWSLPKFDPILLRNFENKTVYRECHTQHWYDN
jgi:hypothetical protein